MPLRHGAHVAVRAQRRLHFVIAVVGRHFGVGEREMMRRGFAGHRQAAALRERHHLDRVTRRNVRHMKARAGQLGQQRCRAPPSRLRMRPECRAVPAARFPRPRACRRRRSGAGLRNDRSPGCRRSAPSPWRGASRAHSSPDGRRLKWRRCRPASWIRWRPVLRPRCSCVIAPMGNTFTTAIAARRAR